MEKTLRHTPCGHANLSEDEAQAAGKAGTGSGGKRGGEGGAGAAGARGRYLCAAVQRGLPEGAAAQDADGDVVQLLLLRRAAAGSLPRAGAGPRARVPATPGLAPKVRVDGIAVSLVLAQHRHDGGCGTGLRVPSAAGRTTTLSLQTPARGSDSSATPRGSMVAPSPWPGNSSWCFRPGGLSSAFAGPLAWCRGPGFPPSGRAALHGRWGARRGTEGLWPRQGSRRPVCRPHPQSLARFQTASRSRSRAVASWRQAYLKGSGSTLDSALCLVRYWRYCSKRKYLPPVILVSGPSYCSQNHPRSLFYTTPKTKYFKSILLTLFFRIWHFPFVYLSKSLTVSSQATFFEYKCQCIWGWESYNKTLLTSKSLREL